MNVTNEDLEIAVAWLRVNEGEDGESEACERVSRMLERELERRLIAAAARLVEKSIARPITSAQRQAIRTALKRKI